MSNTLSNETGQTNGRVEDRVVELVGLAGDATTQMATELKALGWEVRTPNDGANDGADEAALSGLVFDPGLLGPTSDPQIADPAAELRAAIEHARTRFVSSGGRVVVIASRDYLGAPEHVAQAAAGGALISAVRSLALELGRSAITVNLVVGLPTRPADNAPQGAGADGAGTSVGAHVEALLPWELTTADIAATTDFLLDPRSSYITGQVLHCTGGASLLSSLSA